MFLPNERAIEPQITAIYRRFGLNDRQIEILARATPKRDYYCQSRRGNRLFELGLGDVALAFTAASAKSDQAAIEKILAEHGRGAFAAAWLAYRGVGWAADLIPNVSEQGDHQHDPYPSTRGSECRRALDRVTTARSSAQVVVFDPNNYAQNVLTAARALQQINNQITSLQNQAQMLINQARNSSEPAIFVACSSFNRRSSAPSSFWSRRSALPTTCSRSTTPSPTTYAPASSGISSQTLIANAQAPLADLGRGLQDTLRVQAGVVGNLDTNRTQMSALVTSSQSATGALQATQAGNQLDRFAGTATRRSHRDRRGTGSGTESGSRATCRRAGPGQGAAPPLPDARASAINPPAFGCSTDEPLRYPSSVRADRGAGFIVLTARLGRHPQPAWRQRWHRCVARARRAERLPPNWRAAGRSDWTSRRRSKTATGFGQKIAGNSSSQPKRREQMPSPFRPRQTEIRDRDLAG